MPTLMRTSRCCNDLVCHLTNRGGKDSLPCFFNRILNEMADEATSHIHVSILFGRQL